MISTRRSRAPRGSRCGPEPRRERAGGQLGERGRHQQQAGAAVTVKPEAVARALRRLGELRDEQEAREHRDADHEAGEVRRRDRGLAQHREVDQRLVHARLDDDERRRAAARRRSRRRSPASPSPTRPPGRRRAGSRPGARTAARRRASRPARRAGGEGGISRCAAQRRGQRDRLIQNSHARSTLSTITPDSGSPMPPPMPKMALIMRQPGGDLRRAGTCRARCRTRAGTRRRRRPAARGRRSRPRSCGAERVDDGADREEHQHRGEHPALAVEVAELADDRRGDRGREQEAGEEPRDGRRATRRTSPPSPAAPG